MPPGWGVVSLGRAPQAGVVQESKLCSPWVSGNHKVAGVSLWEQQRDRVWWGGLRKLVSPALKPHPPYLLTRGGPQEQPQAHPKCS